MASSAIRKYQAEKGKNLATKEDIQEITKLIEEVRREHAVELERVRGAITLSVGQAAMVRNAHREALLAFFDTALVLLFDKLQVNFGDMPYDDGKTMWEFEQSTGKLFKDLYLGYHRLLLFSEPGASYLSAAHELVAHTFAIADPFRRCLSKVRLGIIAESQALRDGEEELRRAAAKTNAAVAEYSAEIGPARGKGLALFGNYMKELNKHLRDEFGVVVPNLLQP